MTQKTKKSTSDCIYISAITCNAAGGKPKDESNPQALGQALYAERPDFVFLQELTRCGDGDRNEVYPLEELLCAMESGSKPEYQGFYFPSIEKEDHPGLKGAEFANVTGDKRPPKWERSPFKGHKQASQGNGLLIGKEWQLIGVVEKILFDPTNPGHDGYLSEAKKKQPGLKSKFLGNRDSEPRIATMLRVKRKFKRNTVISGKNNGIEVEDDSRELEIALIVTHLSTLTGEHGDDVKARIKKAHGIQRRTGEIKKLCDLAKTEDLVILAGDFNEVETATEFTQLTTVGFKAMTPFCLAHDKLLGSHIQRQKFIDHVWVKPKEALATDTQCKLLRGLEQTTDHRPVLACFRLKPQRSGT